MGPRPFEGRGNEGVYLREGWRGLMYCMCWCLVDDCPINRTAGFLLTVHAAIDSKDPTSALDAAIEFGCYARETGLRKYGRGYLVDAAREACAEMGSWADEALGFAVRRGRPRKTT